MPISLPIPTPPGTPGAAFHRFRALPEAASPGLTLVGVGPGDPDLLTVAAVRAITAADTVAYPVAREGAEGMAATIARPWLEARHRHLPLLLPMVEDPDTLRAAWALAADQLAAERAANRSVALLCEGDVSLFASASYVLLALGQRHPSLEVSLIPGITSVAAAAAAAAWPLALQRQGLLMLPTPESPAELERLLAQAASGGWVLALLKLGRRWSWVRGVLEDRGLLADALFAMRIGWPEQRLAAAADVDARDAPYFSLLLIRQSWPEVLP